MFRYGQTIGAGSVGQQGVGMKYAGLQKGLYAGVVALNPLQTGGTVQQLRRRIADENIGVIQFFLCNGLRGGIAKGKMRG